MTNILSLVPAAVSGITYLGLSLAEGIGALDSLGVFEKLSGSALAAALSFLGLRYLLKERTKQAEQIEKMHQERLEAQSKHQRELIELLRETMNKK